MKKIEIPQTFSHQSPLETISENTRHQFVWLYIFQNNHFFLIFTLDRAFKPPKNVRDIFASWMETETNTMTFPTLNNFMILPLYLNVVTILKDFNLTFLFFQNCPLSQYCRDHQFCHFSTAKIPSWYMAFIRKMVFQRKSNASSINLWSNILGQFKLQAFTTENIYGTRVIYDLWTCSWTDEYKRELRQHLKLWRKFASFPPV